MIGEERFQRFMTLSDTEAVGERIAGSVNRGFWDLVVEYPMGNGMGGGGTSMPYFLQGHVRNPVGMESEFSRILLEQGIIGLVIFITFALWAATRRAGTGDSGNRRRNSRICRR